MYAHELLTDFCFLIPRQYNPPLDRIENRIQLIKEYDKWRENFLKKAIKDSQKFHLGYLGNYAKFTKNLTKQMSSFKDLFRNELSDFRLPYELCWFDMFSNDARHGWLVLQDEDPNELSIHIFERANADLIWYTLPYFYEIVLNRKDFCCFRPIPISDLDRSLVDEYYNEGITEGNCLWYYQTLRHINVALLLLSTKNIIYKKKYPPEKLNRKRLKKNKQPFFSYHTLHVKLPSIRQETRNSQKKTEITTRLHLCRGHFKYYTKEKPLLGKYTGRYWWQSYLRGDKKKGIVLKDYSIKSRN